MKRSIAGACAGLLSSLLITGADAHPHVWVTLHSEILYAPDGAMTGVRHAWKFDDMFSAYALQGIHHAKKGQYTREELASLAQLNVDSLKEYDYFTFARGDGKKQQNEGQKCKQAPCHGEPSIQRMIRSMAPSGSAGK